MEKIDAVITWVDGSEPNYKLKLEEILKNKKIINRQYTQANEIDFCVASIIKFAPFVRKIFIVTDKQKPKFSVIRHVISLEKIDNSYFFETDLLFRCSLRNILISELSGQSNIINTFGNKYPQLKVKENVKTILNEIQDKEKEGLCFEGAEASLELFLRKILGYQDAIMEKNYLKELL